MGKIKLRTWDSAEHLNTDEDIALYLDACLEGAGDDPTFIAKALGNIARARGARKPGAWAALPAAAADWDAPETNAAIATALRGDKRL